MLNRKAESSNNSPLGDGGKKYKGIIVPAVTPLTDKLQMDDVAVAKLFALFYQHNIDPFILGTTGEAASLSTQVKKDYVLAAEKNKKWERCSMPVSAVMYWRKVLTSLLIAVCMR